MSDPREWPTLGPREQPPEAVRVEVAGTVRHDGAGERPVAVLRLHDPTGDYREIQLSRVAAWQLLRGLVSFLFQIEKD